MLTKLEIETSNKIVSWVNTIQTLPFSFQNGKLYPRPTRRRKIALILSVCLTIWNIVHSLLLIQDELQAENFDIIVATLISVTAFLAITFNKLTHWRLNTEFTYLFNQLFLVNKLFGKLYLKREYWISPRREKFFKYLMVYCALNGAFLGVLGYILVYRFVISHLGLIDEQSKWIFVLVLVTLPAYIGFYVNFIAYLDVSFALMLPTLFSIKFWIMYCCEKVPLGQEGTEPQLKGNELRLGKILRVYETITLVNKLNNIVFGPYMYLFLVNGLGMFIAIVSAFGLIRFYRILDAFSILVTVGLSSCSTLCCWPILLFLSSFYDISSNFQKNSSALLFGIPDQRRKSYWAQRIRSCTILKSKVGSFYELEASAKLTTIQTIVDYVVNLLVSTKHLG